MTQIAHKNLQDGVWFRLSLCEQMGNVGSEVGRAINWQKKDNLQYRNKALDRAFELLNLTISDKRWLTRLKELCRAKEVLADFFYGGRIYQTTTEELDRYFFQFALAVRNKK